jgi:hypothetical protein
MDPSSANIRHDRYVEYIGAGSGLVYESSAYYINSSGVQFSYHLVVSLESDHSKRITCYTGRVTAYLYKTEGVLETLDGHNAGTWSPSGDRLRQLNNGGVWPACVRATSPGRPRALADDVGALAQPRSTDRIDVNTRRTRKALR